MRRGGGRLRGLALAALLGSASACGPSDAERMAAALEIASAHREAGRDADSARAYLAALQIDPTRADVNLEIAKLAERLGSPVDAAFYYREAFRLDPSLTEAAMAEARLLAGPDPARAEQTLRRLLELHPHHLQARVLRSSVLLALGEWRKAESEAEEARRRHPLSGEARYAVARVQRAVVEQILAEGRKVPADAIEGLTRSYNDAAARLGPVAAAQALYERALVMERIDLERGLGAYERAYQVARRSGVPALQRRASRAALRLALRSGDRQKARAALERHVELVPEALDSWLVLAALEEREAPGGGEAALRRLVGERPEDPEAYRVLATWLTSRRRVDDAVALLLGAVEEGVSAPELLENAVELLYASERPGEAAELVERLRREHPDHESTAVAAARRALVEGEAQQARDLLEPIAEASQYRDLWYLLGAARLAAGERAGAARALERAIDLSPGFYAKGARLLAVARRGLRDWPGTLEVLEQLVVEGERLTESEQVLRGEALFGLGRSPEALRVLRPLVLRDDPLVAAVLVVARNEKPAEARSTLARALERRPQSVALRAEMARLELDAGDAETALEALGELTEPDAEALLLQARAEAALGRYGRAERSALRAFEAGPGRGEALNLLATLYESQERLDEAISIWTRRREEQGGLPIQARLLLAQLYSRNGQRGRAIQELEAVRTDFPELPGPKNDLAYLLALEDRDLDRALDLAQAARRELGTEPEVADTLGFVYLRKGLVDPALAQLREALDMARSQGRLNPLYFYHLGLALRGAGREDEAALALATALASGEPFAGREDAAAQLQAARRAVSAGS